MDVLDLSLGQIIPYARNPRNNAQAIATVAASIQEFGWRQPIVVDEAMVGLPLYARMIPDRDRDEWVRLEIESNPLPICTRPQVLRSARRT